MTGTGKADSMSTAAVFTSQPEIFPTALLSPGNAAAQNFTHGCKSTTALENQTEMVCNTCLKKRNILFLLLLGIAVTPNFQVELFRFKMGLSLRADF